MSSTTIDKSKMGGETRESSRAGKRLRTLPYDLNSSLRVYGLQGAIEMNNAARRQSVVSSLQQSKHLVKSRRLRHHLQAEYDSVDSIKIRDIIIKDRRLGNV